MTGSHSKIQTAPPPPEPPPSLPPTEARSVVTGESGSAHAEAKASEDRELSDQRRSAGTRTEPQVSQPRLLDGDIVGEKINSEGIMSVSRKLHSGGMLTGPPLLLCWVPWAPGPVGTRLHPHHQQGPLRVPARAGRLGHTDREPGGASEARPAEMLRRRSRVKRSVRSEEPTGETSPTSLPRGHPTASGRVLSK